jgi:hypothetical protein
VGSYHFRSVCASTILCLRHFNISHSFVNLGNPTRMLATTDPEPSSILPIDDNAWDSIVSIL